MKTAAPVHPSAAIQIAYQRDLRNRLIKPMADDLLRELRAAWKADPGIAQDAVFEAAGVMIRRMNTFLLLRRTDGEGWAFPAGGMEFGEPPEACARREAGEETGYAAPTEFKPYSTRTLNSVRFHTFQTWAPMDWEPVLNVEHDAARWVTQSEALQMPDLHVGVRRLLAGPLTMDAPPASRLRTVMERWGRRWTARLETLAEKMAREFADASKGYTDRAVKKSFEEAGLTIKWRPTKKMLEGYAAVVYENVQLIKSIPQKFLTDVQSDVWTTITRTGADMAALTEKIKHSYGVTWRRAALISRDQTAKAKAVFEAARRTEIGVKQAKWLHSHAGREPRPTHVAFNGKVYDVAKGLYDKDEGEWVLPGQLINCRCVSAAVIPGFDED